MNASSLRQKYLSLVSRLYDLASEFTDAELRAIHETLIARDDQGIAKAIDALMLLHGVAVKDRESAASESKILHPTKVSLSHKSARSDSLSAKSLEQLLNDRDLFPRLQDVVELVPGGLILQDRESRSRYIKRVIRHVALLDESSRTQFRKVLSDELAKKPPNFVSQWKNLIREL